MRSAYLMCVLASCTAVTALDPFTLGELKSGGLQQYRFDSTSSASAYHPVRDSVYFLGSPGRVTLDVFKTVNAIAAGHWQSYPFRSYPDYKGAADRALASLIQRYGFADTLENNTILKGHKFMMFRWQEAYTLIDLNLDSVSLRFSLHKSYNPT